MFGRASEQKTGKESVQIHKKIGLLKTGAVSAAGGAASTHQAAPHSHTNHTMDALTITGVPERGRTIEVAPGVRWVRMQLPFALDHINLLLGSGPTIN